MKRKYTNEEVRRWMEERNSRFFYINGEDTNIFVRKYYGIGWTLNLGNPWVLFMIIVLIILSTMGALTSFIGSAFSKIKG
ncbi:DUF5808 domain-containing protein [Microaceticoccus formicicus]|uniref:DUF5808 domain-containing protein n=1 Tax=Microaceticoccus formicicus TaxID=3118105 RepID=UPI003CD00C2D|nr:DUF5808 domain-containing protein [Peptoniphilaceae bacterium AMB_02]